MHKTVLVEGPAVEPITVSEAKTHLNVTSSTHDTYIGSLISTARRQVERYLHRALITQSWKVYYDCWKHELQIPFGSLQSVTTVKYYGVNQEEIQTLTEEDYYWVVTTTDPGSIVRKYDATYPELQYGRPDAIEIAFTAGYGATSAAIPDEIKQAMKILIGNYYSNKEDIVVGAQVQKIPSYITDLIHSYKLYQF